MQVRPPQLADWNGTARAKSSGSIMGELGIGEDVQANPAGERQENVGVSLCRGVFGPTGTKPRRGGNGPDKKQNDGKKRCHA
jgi:hypothetical protein